MNSPSPRLSLIIPVHNGGGNLQLCLDALAASSRQPDELIMVDDASTDGSGDLARKFGARVIRLEGLPRGPGFARNRGAEVAEGELLAFVDGDVAVHEDSLGLLEQTLIEQPEVAAVFGSYDAEPLHRSLVSRYKNLLHHYIHQHSQREAATFWTGCGAIRRDAFLATGGFAEHGTIEDIKLGMRLHRAGYQIWLLPQVQATHLKRWTLAGWLRSDILDRAVPWTRLILSQGSLPGDLNLKLEAQLSAVAVWAALTCLVVGFWFPWAWVSVFLSAVALISLNVDLYRFFAQRGGLGFAIGAAGLHVLYLLYSSLTFGLVLAWHTLRGNSHRNGTSWRGLSGIKQD